MSLLVGLSSCQSLSLMTICCLLLPILNTAAVILPPNGTYGISLTTIKLTDKTRIDPYSSTHQHRSIMLSAFYPVSPLTQCTSHLVPYMPPATAQIQDTYYAPYGLPAGSFQRLHLSLCAPSHSTYTATYPLLLFSPGLGNSRLIYSALAQSIASHGYTVITIDHPHDANVVEYPDGTLVLGANISTLAQIDLALQVRVQDVRFILDVLSDREIARSLAPTREPLNNTSVLIAGHSLGGATAAQAMLVDRRVRGGVDLDGTFFGSVVKKGLGKRQPFLIFGHEGKNNTNDATWEEVWGRLGGWRRELGLKGSQHATFSDLPLLVDVLGLRDVLSGVSSVLGTIGGERARLVVSTFLAAFGRFVKSGVDRPLLDGGAEAWPEVMLVAK